MVVVEIDRHRVVVLGIPVSLLYGHDVVVSRAVKRIAETEHRRPKNAATSRAGESRPSRHRWCALLCALIVIGRLKPGQPLLVGPLLGICGWCLEADYWLSGELLPILGGFDHQIVPKLVAAPAANEFATTTPP